MFSPTLHSTGVGRRRSRRDGALAGDRPEGPPEGLAAALQRQPASTEGVSESYIAGDADI